MKNTFLVLLLLFVGNLTAFAQPLGIYAGTRFKGTIDGKYEIILALNPSTLSEGQYFSINSSGYYEYTSTQKPIRLRGTIDKANKLVLDAKKEDTVDERFDGDYNAVKGTFTGTWSKLSKNKTAPFSLSVLTHPQRNLFATFLNSHFAADDMEEPIKAYHVAIEQDLLFIGGYGDMYEMGDFFAPIERFTDVHFSYGEDTDSYGSSHGYNYTFQVLPNSSKCTILQLFHSYSEREDSEGNAELDGSISATVFQWNGSSFVDISASAFPAQTKRAFSLPNDATNSTLTLEFVNESSFRIGEDALITDWKWDGLRFNKP